MESLARRLGGLVADSSGLTGDKREVMIYGFLALFQTAVILLVSLIFAFLCSMVCEAMIIFTAVGLIRRCTGGVHSSSMTSCTIQSCVVICSFAAISRYLLAPLDYYVYLCLFTIAVFAGFVIIWRKAPMDTENKRIKSQQKKNKLKFNSFVALFVCLALSAALYFIGFHKANLGFSISLKACAYSLLSALYWQCFTLTPPAAYLTGAIDRLF